MSIYQKSLDDIALHLSRITGLTITKNHFTLHNTVATDHNGYNTKTTILFKDGAPVSGNKTFYYNRLDLASLVNLNTLRASRRSKINLGDNTSVYDILSSIRDAVGIQFDADDLEETFTTFDGTGISITLKAKATSVGWLGQYIQTFSSAPSISTAFHGYALNGF